MKEIIELCYDLCISENESVKRQIMLMTMNLEYKKCVDEFACWKLGRDWKSSDLMESWMYVNFMNILWILWEHVMDSSDVCRNDFDG